MRRRHLVFVPSLVLGILGGAWMALHPYPYLPRVGLVWQLVAGLALGAVLLAAAGLLERTLPSFRFASALLEQALRGLALPPSTALVLAAATAVAEELFFRGALLPLVGLLVQALLFGLLHPVPRRAWAYPAFAVVAGLAFGGLTLTTGSLLSPMAAHFVVNVQGFWQVRSRESGLP